MSSGTGPQKDDRPPRVAPRFRCLDVEIDETGKAAHILDPSFKLVDVKAGGTVRWHFTNNSNAPIRVGVAHFVVAEHYREDTPDWREYRSPLVDDTPMTEVKEHGVGTLTCKIKDLKNLRFPDHSSITYKYDIVDEKGKVLLDPEIEIPNQAY